MTQAMTNLQRASSLTISSISALPTMRSMPTMPWTYDGVYGARSSEAGLSPDWEANVERYYPAESINGQMKDWLHHSIAWMKIEEAGRTYGHVRAVVDWLGAALLIVLLLPVMLLIVGAIKLNSPGPAFYVQTRIGRGGRAFRIWKFRTMYDGAERNVPFENNCMAGGMFKVPHDARILPLGRFLRRWSLDELPQLFNVVRGDMLLIGPRPLEPEHACAVPIDCYDRFAMRPGLTGLWQATARDTRDGLTKFRMDAEYVRHRSLKLDLRLLKLTFVTVLTGVGAE